MFVQSESSHIRTVCIQHHLTKDINLTCKFLTPIIDKYYGLWLNETVYKKIQAFIENLPHDLSVQPYTFIRVHHTSQFDTNTSRIITNQTYQHHARETPIGARPTWYHRSYQPDFACRISHHKVTLYGSIVIHFINYVFAGTTQELYF
jgi:hypothetical protein